LRLEKASGHIISLNSDFYPKKITSVGLIYEFEGSDACSHLVGPTRLNELGLNVGILFYCLDNDVSR
jgi:hypothetical protein